MGDDQWAKIEAENGYRQTWNSVPSSRIEVGRKLVVPIAGLYTPMKHIPNIAQLGYPPVVCTCQTILNPYAPIDPNSKTWTCPSCFNKNELPIHYRNITEGYLPQEAMPGNNTVEYVLKPPTIIPPPVFLFVIDTCVDNEKGMQAIKDSILGSLGRLPENSIVGLITFGPMVHVYELSFQHCPKALIFRGSKELTPEQIRTSISLPPKGLSSGTNHNKFLRPLSEIQTHFENIIEELPREPALADQSHLPLRATGTALSIAVSLLEDSFPQQTGQTARIITFLAGTPTIGPGMISTDDLRELPRSHSDIAKGKAKYVQKATQYYTNLAAQAVKNNIIVDVFSFSFDQTGVLEMKELIRSTGGVCARGDDFDDPVFKESYHRLFKPPVNDEPNCALDVGITAQLNIVVSRYLKIAGVIGPCSGLPNNSQYVSDENKIGVHGTSKFKLLSIHRSTTLAVYFDVVNNHQNKIPDHEKAIIQFDTIYHKVNGKKILRVTTIARPWVNDVNAGLNDIRSGFDQDAAAVIMARSAIWRAENEESFETVRWIDMNLIKLVQKIGADYTPGIATNLVLHQSFKYFPQFMFHFRRSPFIQTMGDTPDQTAQYRQVLNRETVENTLLMMQPVLEKFSLEERQYVELSSDSFASNAVFLLDTYFNVLVVKGLHIKDWVQKGFDKSPDHENVRQLLRVPVEEAQAILDQDRFPMPRYVVCYEREPPARYLDSVLDPSRAGNKLDGVGGTDDVSFHVFYEHLKKLAVQPS
eukprot:TRINITY_DN2720_c0_g1_i1.p1 TRINITY_DN2720_c0_g1~~TRINITY_DN2720_c0_g1_i1.p1  ORF type:complete len:757 (+),score=135.63 TRINITY_DN2720_c0_g1_i1:139-2409(+)